MQAAKTSKTPLSCLLNIFVLSPPWPSFAAMSSELNAVLSSASPGLQVGLMAGVDSFGHAYQYKNIVFGLLILINWHQSMKTFSLMVVWGLSGTMRINCAACSTTRPCPKAVVDWIAQRGHAGRLMGWMC
jgi:hypothetical protein